MTLTAAQLKFLRGTEAIGGTKLKAARRLAGLTQVQMAESLGVHQSALSEWERGRFEPTLGTARKFAEFFGCAIEDLFPSASAGA